MATLFRKNHEAVAIPLDRIMEKWKDPADITTSEASLVLSSYILLENNKTNFAHQLIDLILGKCEAMWDRVHQDSQHPVHPAPGAQLRGAENQESQGPEHCHQAPGGVEERISGLPIQGWDIYIYIYIKTHKTMSSSFVWCSVILFTSVSSF